MSGDTELDAELNAILNADGGDDPTHTAGSAQTQAAEEKIKAGGREFTKDEIAKAYDSLLKDYTKKSQVGADAERWLKFGKNLDQHPDLKNKLHKMVQEYNAGQARSSGPGQTDPLLMQQMKAMQDRLDQMALEKEESALRDKYKLNDEQVLRVMEKANELGGGVPLELVHRAIAFDEVKAQAAKEAASKTAASTRAKANAHVGGSQAANVAPASKEVADMSQDEIDAGILADLESAGY